MDCNTSRQGKIFYAEPDCDEPVAGALESLQASLACLVSRAQTSARRIDVAADVIYGPTPEATDGAKEDGSPNSIRETINSLDRALTDIEDALGRL